MPNFFNELVFEFKQMACALTVSTEHVRTYASSCRGRDGDEKVGADTSETDRDGNTVSHLCLKACAALAQPWCQSISTEPVTTYNSSSAAETGSQDIHFIINPANQGFVFRERTFKKTIIMGIPCLQQSENSFLQPQTDKEVLTLFSLEIFLSFSHLPAEIGLVEDTIAITSKAGNHLQSKGSKGFDVITCKLEETVASVIKPIL
ncbi:uncharacterized protein A4U43_C04F5820 [Asparagus officinalis]|uniref:Uncharacterized protein n=1 Tax=Asparagus officinalis TaxID=4686 RepID=A0A5P1F3H9_ASPOF|nr:uncharacterized protein A4U43_C04F5820 [Asparagus officinalis]